MDGVAFCLECGGRLADGLSCRAQLDDILAMESLDPALQALHFYSVSAYNMQHPSSFVPEAYGILKDMFIEAVDKEWGPPETRGEMRRRMADFDGSRKVVKPDGEREIVLRAWPMTIADARVPGDPRGTAERVKAWAASVRKELG